MKALLLSALVFFSLKAFSSEVGENKAVECQLADQSKRDTKVVEQPAKEEVKKEDTSTKSK